MISVPGIRSRSGQKRATNRQLLRAVVSYEVGACWGFEKGLGLVERGLGFCKAGFELILAIITKAIPRNWECFLRVS